MFVPYWFVTVQMNVWVFGHWIMMVLMVSIIVDVSVGMLHCLMFVFMFMTFS